MPSKETVLLIPILQPTLNTLSSPDQQHVDTDHSVSRAIDDVSLTAAVEDSSNATTEYRIWAKEMQYDDGSVEREEHDDDWTLVVVHGGPGIADHTELLSAFETMLGSRSSDCRNDNTDTSNHKAIISRVIFFDQLGCGNSYNYVPDYDSDDGGYHYSLEGHVNQLKSVIHYIYENPRRPSNGKVAVLGYSWGGQVLLEYLLSISNGGNGDGSGMPSSSSSLARARSSLIDVAIVSNTPLDAQTYASRQYELRMALDSDIRSFYEYEEQLIHDRATMIGSATRGRRQDVGPLIYRRLIGISDTNIVGEMKDWNIWDGIDALLSPSTTLLPRCLFICTKDDTVPWQDYDRLRRPHQQQERQSVSSTPTEDDNDSYTISQALSKSSRSNNDNSIKNNNFMVVIMDEGGGHGPFFGPTSKDYFDLLSQFIFSSPPPSSSKS